MNLILFNNQEWGQALPAQDFRSKHILEILRLNPGDPIKLGKIGDSWGLGQFLGRSEKGLIFHWPDRTMESPPPYELILLIGTPRPPTARRLLKDLTTLGASAIHFTPTDLGEKSYLQSSLWTKCEYRENLLEGAQQGETTHLPEVYTHSSLFKALGALPERGTRIAPELPKHGKPPFLWPLDPPKPLILALGPERGWSEKEREALEARGFQFLPLGPRNLRTETATIGATILVLERYFWV